jgi:hypothetical protein
MPIRERLTIEQRESLSTTLKWLGVGTVYLGIAYAYVFAVGYTPRVLWSDPARVTGWPWFLGLVAATGIVLWAVTATTTLLAAAFTPDLKARAALRWLGGVTLFMMVDDQIQLHEDILPRAGIPEQITFLVYAAVIGVVGLRYLSFYLKGPNAPALVIGAFLLAVSIVLDQFPWAVPGRANAENTAKLLGLAAFAVYGIRTALSAGRASADGPRTSGAASAAREAAPPQPDEQDPATERADDGLGASRGRPTEP